MTISGVYTSIITPFTRQQTLDEEGLRQNIRNQKGVDGITVIGTTGEETSLDSEEKERVLSIVREETALPLSVGCGSASTKETIDMIKKAAHLGANSALIVTPYYIKPTQEGIYRHFSAISHDSPLPIIIYNNPGRAGVNIEAATVKRLAELPNIIGIKECSGNLVQAAEIIASTPPEFALLSGDDPLTLPLLALGAKGVISVASNLIPQQVATLVHSALDLDFKKARELHMRFFPFFKIIFSETNPIPIKAAMQLCGFPAGNPRLPLTPLSSHLVAKMEKILEQIGLLATV